jgi:hypothetical protein
MEMTASGAMRKAKSHGRSRGGGRDWSSRAGGTADDMRVRVACGGLLSDLTERPSGAIPESFLENTPAIGAASDAIAQGGMKVVNGSSKAP